VDVRLDSVLAAQRGLVTRGQALALGVSPGQLGHLLATGRLVPAVVGVYRDPARPTAPGQLALAATLRWGDAVASSHQAAARLYGWSLLDPPSGWQVTASRPVRVPADWTVHRARLSPGDCRVGADGRLTAPARTLFDLARSLPLVPALVAADSACHGSPRLLGELTSYVSAHPGRPGVPAVRALLPQVEPLAESPLETLLRLVLVRGGLPRPEAQLELAIGGRWLRADLGYRWARLLLEADGRREHEGWERAQADRLRQNLLVNAGWRVLRFTWADVTARPGFVVATVARALGR
jgi:very-short-patch-repair endonuclease